jgi:hypothetical protein
MSADVGQLCKDALELPLDQRLTLVNRILEQSDDYLSSGEVEQEWDQVVRERMERYKCGKTSSRPASDVFDTLDKRLDG